MLMTFYFLTCLPVTQSQYSSRDLERFRDRVKTMLRYSYGNYLKYAFPADSLRPIRCTGTDNYGGYSLTLVDSLDTLALLGEKESFVDAYWKSAEINFDIDRNVSVFETNIRVVGGLLGGHFLAKLGGVNVSTGWPCSGPLLEKAVDVAERLLPAFETKTGLPYGTINLRHGVPLGETPVTCVAGAGTFILEFGILSKLTGDSRFERIAKKALDVLWQLKTPINLIGDHINVQTGQWVGTSFTIGSGIDSYLEYLLKGGLFFNDDILLSRFHTVFLAAENYTKVGNWHVYVDAITGTKIRGMFQSLDAFYPGLMASAGYASSALRLLVHNHLIWQKYNCMPEHFCQATLQPLNAGVNYPLRPEHVESIALLAQLYCHNNESGQVCNALRRMAVDVLVSIEYEAVGKCGYCTVADVRSGRLSDEMESFFIAETLKYLYLALNGSAEMFSYEEQSNVCVEGLNVERTYVGKRYIFNTEAHVMDRFATYLCFSLQR